MIKHGNGCCCSKVEDLDFEFCEKCECCYVSPEELAEEEALRKEMQPYFDHVENCDNCLLLQPPCFIGAKLANPNLPDKDEASYLKRIKEAHTDCEWCNG